MTMQFIASTAISGVDYDEVTQDLAVYFMSGHVYVYHGVSPEEYQALLAAPSAGAFVNQVIKAHGYHQHKGTTP